MMRPPAFNQAAAPSLRSVTVVVYPPPASTVAGRSQATTDTAYGGRAGSCPAATRIGTSAFWLPAALNSADTSPFRVTCAISSARTYAPASAGTGSVTPTDANWSGRIGAVSAAVRAGPAVLPSARFHWSESAYPSGVHNVAPLL